MIKAICISRNISTKYLLFGEVFVNKYYLIQLNTYNKLDCDVYDLNKNYFGIGKYSDFISVEEFRKNRLNKILNG